MNDTKCRSWGENLKMAATTGRGLLTLLFLAGVLMVGMIGCRSTKKIRKVIAMPSTTQKKDTTVASVVVKPAATPEDRHADSLRLISQTLERLARNRVDFQTFSSRMKVHYEGGDGKDYEFNAFIHMKKDSMIWVSVNLALGIEAFRLLITPDSVKILDKLKKVVRLRSVSFLQDEIHLPVDFKALQDLLIGNPIYLDSNNIVFYKKEQLAAKEQVAGISLMCAGDFFKNYLTLNGDMTLKHAKLDDVDPMRARTCDLTYGDYEQQGPLRFSTYRKISVAEKSKVDIEIVYKQYKFNEALSFSFSIPRNYKRK